MAVPNVGWGDARATVVLFARSTCGACEDSVPFYRRVSQAVAAEPDTQLVVLSTDSEPVLDTWLRAHDIVADATARVLDPNALGLFVTPTILFVASDGSVTDRMQLLLSKVEEEVVLNRIGDPALSPVDNMAAYIELGGRDLVAVLDGRPAQYVDVSDRASFRGSDRPGATRIPIDEFPTRARVELLKSSPVVIDCSSETVTVCQMAAKTLRDRGFPEVLLYRESS